MAEVEEAVKASEEAWGLIGTGIGMVLLMALLAAMGSLRRWLLGLVPKLVAKFKSYPDLKDAEQNHRVYTELVELRALTDADRSYVLRFHNGSEFLPDNPVWKVTCTHETVRSGVSYESQNIQAVIVSRIHTLVDPAITGDSKYPGVSVFDCSKCPQASRCRKDNKHVVIVQVDEMDGSYGKFHVEAQNIKTIVLAGIVGGGRVFGLVGVDFCNVKTTDAERMRSVVERVCHSAETVQYYLQYRDVPVPAAG